MISIVPPSLIEAAQRVAVQRRAVEIGTAIGTNPRSKKAPISWREARPLQRLVRPQPTEDLSHSNKVGG